MIEVLYVQKKRLQTVRENVCLSLSVDMTAGLPLRFQEATGLPLSVS